jgi:hypothetical protein
LDEKTRRQNERYDRAIKVIDQINQNYPLDYIEMNNKNIPRICSQKSIAKKLAVKYGTLKITISRECGAEMAQFACRNSRVLGILANDSDFLIYPENWRCCWKYFSISAINPDTLHTMEYNRAALRSYLKLSDKELILFSTLNGNDVVLYDDTETFHKTLLTQRDNSFARIPAIARYIRTTNIIQEPNLYRKVAVLIYGDDDKSHVQKIRESFEFYDIVSIFTTNNFLIKV